MILPPKNAYTNKSCFHCIHYKTQYTREDGIIERDVPNCIAFPNPEGIPDEIYDFGHYEPRPDLGQKNDVVFEPNEELIHICIEYDERLATGHVQPDFGQSATGVQ